MSGCPVCGGSPSIGTVLRCSHCGRFFCEYHLGCRSHGCRGAGPGAEATRLPDAADPDVCPRCGSGELYDGYWGSIRDTPINESSLDWETRLLWWFKAPDFISFESIEKVDGRFCLHNVGGERVRKCKRCGHAKSDEASSESSGTDTATPSH